MAVNVGKNGEKTWQMKIEVQDSVSLFKISGVLFLVMTRTGRGCAMVHDGEDEFLAKRCLWNPW